MPAVVRRDRRGTGTEMSQQLVAMGARRLTHAGVARYDRRVRFSDASSRHCHHLPAVDICAGGFARGYWLVTSLYLVIDADLSAFQLVFLGTAQGLTTLVVEVPTGVVADTFSRKWSVVIAHLVTGTGMLITGLVTAFPALVATQMLWGLGWTFSSGAEVAWLTDELDEPDRVARVLTAGARWQQVGAIGGMVGFGALAWAIDLSPRSLFLVWRCRRFSLYVVARFTERRFTPTRKHRWRASASIFRRGIELARRDQEILLVFAATVLVNGAAEAFERLFPKQLVALGFPGALDPIVWLTALGSWRWLWRGSPYASSRPG